MTRPVVQKVSQGHKSEDRRLTDAIYRAHLLQSSILDAGDRVACRGVRRSAPSDGTEVSEQLTTLLNLARVQEFFDEMTKFRADLQDDLHQLNAPRSRATRASSPSAADPLALAFR